MSLSGLGSSSDPEAKLRDGKELVERLGDERRSKPRQRLRTWFLLSLVLAAPLQQ